MSFKTNPWAFPIPPFSANRVHLFNVKASILLTIAFLNSILLPCRGLG